MLKTGKHTIKEIDGKLCSIVETELTKERLEFLSDVLKFNDFGVYVEENVLETDTTYTLGVDDMRFNPMINVYENTLKRPGGGMVTVNYWNQIPEEEGLPYFGYREKNADVFMEDEFISNPWAFRTIG